MLTPLPRSSGRDQRLAVELCNVIVDGALSCSAREILVVPLRSVGGRPREVGITEHSIQQAFGFTSNNWRVSENGPNRIVLERFAATRYGKPSGSLGRQALYQGLVELRVILADRKIYREILGVAIREGQECENRESLHKAIKIFLLTTLLKARSDDQSRGVILEALRDPEWPDPLLGAIASLIVRRSGRNAESAHIFRVLLSTIRYAGNILEQNDSQVEQFVVEQSKVQAGSPHIRGIQMLADRLIEKMESEEPAAGERKIRNIQMLVRLLGCVVSWVGSREQQKSFQDFRRAVGIVPECGLGWNLPLMLGEVHGDLQVVTKIFELVYEVATQATSRYAQRLSTASYVKLVEHTDVEERKLIEAGLKLLFSYQSFHPNEDFDLSTDHGKEDAVLLGSIVSLLSLQQAWRNRSEASRVEIAVHIAKRVMELNIPEENWRQVAEVFEEHSNLLPFAYMLWNKADDFSPGNCTPAAILNRFRERSILPIFDRVLRSQATFNPQDTSLRLSAIYRKLDRDPARLTDHIMTVHDIAEDSVEQQADRVLGRFKLDVSSGIVEGRLEPTDHLIEHFLVTELAIDSPPYAKPFEDEALKDSDFMRCYRQVIEVQFAAYDRYFGQGALQFACRRASPECPALYERFLKACCRDFKVVRSNHRDSYPGSTFIGNGLKLFSVFPRAELARSLTQIYPWAREVLGVVKDSTVIYSRGLRCVIPPSDARFSLGNRSYGLLSFQDHFGDLDGLGVSLVNVALLKRLRDSLINGMEFQNSKELLSFLNPQHDDVLPITELANLGGFSHAWDPSSSLFPPGLSSQIGVRD